MTDALGRLKFNFDSPRSPIEPVDLSRRNTRRQIGVCTEQYRENRLWAFPQRLIERRSLIDPNTSHATPKSENLVTDEEVGLQRAEISFLGGWSQESIVTAAIVKFKACPYKQYAIRWTHRQWPDPRPKGFFIRFIKPGFRKIVGMTSDPYRVPLKVSHS
jgi:hypothetical protein